MRYSITLASLLALGSFNLAAVAQEAPPAGGERLVSGIGYFAAGAARPAWSTQGDWIAFDKRGDDGYRDVYIARTDAAFDRCITCELNEFDKRHAGNAQWHPSGRYLLFQAEAPFRQEGEPLPFLAIPGRNRGDAVWIVSVEGRDLWKIVDRTDRGGRIHSPRFSFEGELLAWSERVAGGGDLWGDWVVRLGEFAISRGVPRVRDVRTLEPSAQKAFYETNGFTPDDNGLLLSGNFVEGQPVDGLDVYVVDSATEAVRQLTKSVGRWDRFPAIAPDGRTVVWSSSETLRLPQRPLLREDAVAVVELDLWLAALDGSWSRRLTGFNDPLSDEYLGRVMVGPAAWSPKGDRLLVTVTPLDSPRQTDLFVVELATPYGPDGRR